MSHLPPMTTRIATLTGGVLLCGLVWAAAGNPAAAQAAPGNAVDTNIADRDPLATSLRRVEPGNAQFSFESRLTVVNFSRSWSPFEPATPTTTDASTGLVHSQAYQFRSPGVRALIDRPAYAPLRNGGEVMIVPANTVFQLTLERPVAPADTRPAAHDNFMDQRVDLRVQRVPGASMLAFPQASVREDQPMPTLDLAQMRYPQIAAQATSAPLIPVERMRASDEPGVVVESEAAPFTSSEESQEALD